VICSYHSYDDGRASEVVDGVDFRWHRPETVGGVAKEFDRGVSEDALVLATRPFQDRENLLQVLVVG
jgi:hypothetical protein